MGKQDVRIAAVNENRCTHSELSVTSKRNVGHLPLRNDIMKPYSQARLTNKKRIFNYRLSRARRIVENAFGILSNRFRVFMTPMRLFPEKVKSIVLACCTLHNFLRSSSTSRSVYTPLGSFHSEDTDTHYFTPGTWRRSNEAQGIVSLNRQGSNRTSIAAKIISIQRRGQSHGKIKWFDLPVSLICWILLRQTHP